MTTTRSSNPWAAEEQRARAALEASSKAIDRSPRGVPAGGISKRTTVSKGYVVISAQFGGRCLECHRKIPKGRQVRYWFGHGITCRNCILAGT